MKHILVYIVGLICIVPSLFVACDGLDEHYSTDPNLRLTFSEDTLSFDTVFTSIGSATKKFMIYNQNKEAMNIQSIMLASGGESGFRLNVDGRKGDYFDNVGILGEDSMFVFVEVTVDPTASNQPLLVQDSVVFMTNAGKQSVVLEAYGQNVHIYKGGWNINRDTTLTADLPHLVYDSIRVAPGVTLTIDSGTTLYMHDKANIIVAGRLVSSGILEKPVTIRGDRLDFVLEKVLPYDRTPGQWGGIFFTPESKGNVMDYTVVRNATNGITIDADTPDEDKLTIRNCQFSNMKENVFTSVNSKVSIVNTEFSNAGGAVVTLAGGEYHFIHCTMVNYMRLIKRNAACLALANVYPSENGELKSVPLKVRFDNCIVDGSFGAGNGKSGGEVAVSFVDEAVADYHFNHCVIATTTNDQEHFKETLFVTEGNQPAYRKLGGEANRYQFDFRPDTISSLGVGKADPAIAAKYPEDRLGVNRMENGTGPTIGAYEYVEKESDNK